MKLPDSTAPAAFEAFLDSRELREEPHPRGKEDKQ
jgi:hypothetical protein